MKICDYCGKLVQKINTHSHFDADNKLLWENKLCDECENKKKKEIEAIISKYRRRETKW